MMYLHGLIDQINLKRHTTITAAVKKKHENTYLRVKFDEEGSGKSTSLNRVNREHYGSTPCHGSFLYDKPSTSINLPKLKLNPFDGTPHERPKLSSMYVATVHRRNIPNSEKK